MKKKKKIEGEYLYRVRGIGADEYCSAPYSGTDNISDVGPVIGEFLSKNFIFTMNKCMHYSGVTWDKEMIILGSKDCVLEIEKPIYDRYKDEIDSILIRNMNEAVNKYIKDGKTKIVVRMNLSGCEYEFEEESTDLLDVSKICGLKTLFISDVNPLDVALFKNIIIDLIGPDKPGYPFLNSNDILLQAGERSLVLDRNAYNLMVDIIKEHELNLNNRGNSKAIQMKLEDNNE